MKNTDKKYETYEYMCNLDRVERFKKGLANDIKDAYTARDFKEVLNKTFYPARRKASPFRGRI